MNLSTRRGTRIGGSVAIVVALGLIPRQTFAQGQIDPTGVRGLNESGDPLSRPMLPAGAEDARRASFQAPGEPIRTDVTPTTEPRPDEPPATPIEGGEIIARVDGQVILVSDVMWQARQMMANSTQPIPPDKMQEVQQYLIRQLTLTLVDTKLLYSDFRRTVPPENMPKIEETLSKPFEEAEIPKLKKMLKTNDRAEIEAKLNDCGTSLKDVQRQFTEKTIAGEWLRQKTPKPNPVTHDEMLEYYQQHIEEYRYEAQVKWEELMVRFDQFNGDRDAAWAALAAMGNAVWEKAQANPGVRGAVFADVAKAKSQGFTAADGGLHDWMTMGALKCAALNDALAALPVGQMSAGIESEQGFHIVRVLDRKAAGCTPFTEAQTKIRETLEMKAKSKLFQQELAKIRKTARVWTIFDGDINGDRLAELLDGPTRR
jgi:hypothetical protein